MIATLSKLVVASGNPGKLRELDALLAPLGIETVPQTALCVPEAEEPHDTFIENALAKARNAAVRTGLPSLADDSGILADALDGAPGVLSARFAGEPKSDERNNQKLIELLRAAPTRAAPCCAGRCGAKTRPLTRPVTACPRSAART